MNQVIATLLFSLISIPAFAASPEVLKAVLSSQEIANVQNIDKVQVTNTYRCMNCYDIEIIGTNVLGPAFVKVHTSQTPGTPLIVTYIEGSK